MPRLLFKTAFVRSLCHTTSFSAFKHFSYVCFPLPSLTRVQCLGCSVLLCWPICLVCLTAVAVCLLLSSQCAGSWNRKDVTIYLLWVYRASSLIDLSDARPYRGYKLIYTLLDFLVVVTSQFMTRQHQAKKLLEFLYFSPHPTRVLMSLGISQK